MRPTHDRGPDHEAIRQLLYRYCELMDAGDFTPLAALFADAVMVDGDGNLVAEGRAGVQALYERGTRLYDGSPRTRHLTSNSIIDVDSAAGTASARSVYVVFQATENLALQPIISGRYHDRFARPMTAHGISWNAASGSIWSVICPNTSATTCRADDVAETLGVCQRMARIAV